LQRPLPETRVRCVKIETAPPPATNCLGVSKEK
jgi:hypothetical protein